ncbi:unnamed protein product [Protopolystoma xenopodis]|uniref:Uncharacterized protein n=1 Tax=Protopolystoma xenopodis TaxID=117903 RepID=A0A448WU69_9PLAT|nr:unnamed protein product [Protopolystoma xenopodis]
MHQRPHAQIKRNERDFLSLSCNASGSHPLRLQWLARFGPEPLLDAELQALLAQLPSFLRQQPAHIALTARSDWPAARQGTLGFGASRFERSQNEIEEDSKGDWLSSVLQSKESTSFIPVKKAFEQHGFSKPQK